MSIRRIAENLGAGVMPLPSQSNFVGSFLVGTYPEFLPGGFQVDNIEQRRKLAQVWGHELPAPGPSWDLVHAPKDHKLNVLYLMGTLYPAPHSVADHVIYQSIYPPPSIDDADLVLPAAAFTESDGTLINGEGRLQRLFQSVDPSGAAMADWQILCKLAQRMGAAGFEYSSSLQIRREIASVVPGIDDAECPQRAPVPISIHGRIHLSAPEKKTAKKPRAPQHVLNVSPTEHSYRGHPLSVRVPEAGQIFAEELLELNIDDAKTLGLTGGDMVVVSWNGTERAYPIRITAEQPAGSCRAIMWPEHELAANSRLVNIRKADV